MPVTWGFRSPPGPVKVTMSSVVKLAGSIGSLKVNVNPDNEYGHSLNPAAGAALTTFGPTPSQVTRMSSHSRPPLLHG